MEWVETTGRTIDDAKEAALDQLGVDEHDAEFEVLEEPRTGLFGRVRGEARVRARVKPSRPRPKVERRDRRRKGSEGRSEGRSRQGTKSGGQRGRTATTTAPDSGSSEPAAESESESEPESVGTSAGGGARTGAPRRRRRGGRGGGSGGAERTAATVSDKDTGANVASGEEGNDMSNDATVEDQAEITSTFLTGLVEAFGFDATLNEERVDDDTIELKVEGEDLGLLIGPKGQTLQAIQELARTVVQRQATGTHHGRIRIDVAGYRQRRKEALERFATQVAADVVASGVQKALEPMHPADRKVVHDTINEIDGVSTTSEGEEPRRRVVILPASDGDS